MHWLLTGLLSVEKLTVKITDLPASLQGLKLVQLSDFHYDGHGLSEELLQQAIAQSNLAEPDLVLLTGDYITNKTAPIHDLVLRLKYLESRFGTYAVLGNHDIFYCSDPKTGYADCPTKQKEITTALTNIGVNVLWNEIAYPLGKELPLVGLADYRSKEFNPAPVMSQLDPNVPRIVLSHNPDSAAILQQWRVDLQLSGHTHGGQITIPGIGSVAKLFPIQSAIRQLIPQRLRSKVPYMKRDFTKMIKYPEWMQGFHQVGANKLYINRGLGSYVPGRFFCRPEVTIITLS